MQNRAYESRDSELERSNQTPQLGQNIYARYAMSPGVMSPGLGSGLTGQILRFTERVPLLHSVYQRWNVQGGSFGMLTNPVWLRSHAALRSVMRPTGAEHSKPARSPQEWRTVAPSVDGATSNAGVSQSQEAGSNASMSANSSEVTASPGGTPGGNVFAENAGMPSSSVVQTSLQAGTQLNVAGSSSET